MKQVLVIGGSYFAGRVFVESLSQSACHQIHVFNRGHLLMAIPGVCQLTGDREIPAHVSDRIPHRHWDVVVDFCAYTPDHIRTLIGGLGGTVGHYIFISTTSVYAPTPQVPIPEDAPKVTGPQPELGEFADYGYQKWLAECAVADACRMKGIHYTILRPSIIYGRYNYAPRESFFFDHVLAAKPLVVPDNPHIFYSFIWVEDLADIIIACMENDQVFGDAYHVASDEWHSYHTMADTIEEVCGRKIARRPMGTEEILRQGIPMPFPPDAHLLYDGKKLARILGFEHTPFILAMAKTWADYQQVVARRTAFYKKRHGDGG